MLREPCYLVTANFIANFETTCLLKTTAMLAYASVTGLFPVFAQHVKTYMSEGIVSCQILETTQYLKQCMNTKERRI